MDQEKVDAIAEKFIQRYAARHAEYDRQVAEAREVASAHLRELGIETDTTELLVSLSVNPDELMRNTEMLSALHYADFNEDLATLSDDECVAVRIIIMEYIRQEMNQRIEQARSRFKREMAH